MRLMRFPLVASHTVVTVRQCNVYEHMRPYSYNRHRSGIEHFYRFRACRNRNLAIRPQRQCHFRLRSDAKLFSIVSC